MKGGGKRSSDPNLCKHGIQRSPQEYFYFQVLLDPFVKGFDLPALLVEIGNGLGIQMFGIGKETIFLAGLLILIADKAEWIWDGPKQDGLIPDDARRFAAPAFVQIFDSGVAFQAVTK